MVREIYRKGCDSKAISSWVLKSPTKIAEIRTGILTGIWSLSTLSSQQQFRFREVPVPHSPISTWALFLPPPPNLHMCVHSVQVTLSVGWCKAILPGQHWQTFQNQDKLGKKVIRGQLVFLDENQAGEGEELRRKEGIIRIGRLMQWLMVFGVLIKQPQTWVLPLTA